MVNTYAAQSGGCRFESLWGFGFSLKGAYYEVGYCGKKNFLSWTAMHIDFVMCKNTVKRSIVLLVILIHTKWFQNNEQRKNIFLNETLKRTLSAKKIRRIIFCLYNFADYP